MLREYARIPLPGPVDAEMSERILTICMSRLEARRPTKLERCGNCVRFVGGAAIRPGMNWSLLVPVSRGEVTVEDADGGGSVLVFRASILDFLVAALGITAFGEVACLFMKAPGFIYAVWPVLCLFGFGTEILIVKARFRWFFKRCISLAMEQSGVRDA